MNISDYTLVLLLLGLLPLFIVVIWAARSGGDGFLSLRFFSVVFLWVGYHLSPWLAYLSDNKWDSFLLVPKFVDKGLLFSFYSMMCVFLGSVWITFKDRKKFDIFSKKQFRVRLPRIKRNWLLALMAISLLLFLINVGGFAQVWNASYFRGEGQFNQREGVEKILQVLRVLTTPINASLACMAALVVLQENRMSFMKFFGYLALLISSLQSMHGFSRGAGYPFVILAFLSLRLKRKKRILLAVLASFFALYLGSVGLNNRGSYTPGLGNFLEATQTDQSVVPQKTYSIILSPEKNPLDAMAPWTRKAMEAVFENSSVEVMGVRFLWNLHPFPSEFVPLTTLGKGLAEVMGTEGNTGITTPALAELYFAFGMSGAVFMLFIGMLYAYFEKQMFLRPGIISTVCLLLCFISLPIGLHNSMRAMTRPLLYAVVIHWGVSRFQKYKAERVGLKGRGRWVWNS